MQAYMTGQSGRTLSDSAANSARLAEVWQASGREGWQALAHRPERP